MEDLTTKLAAGSQGFYHHWYGWMVEESRAGEEGIPLCFSWQQGVGMVIVGSPRMCTHSSAVHRSVHDYIEQLHHA